MLSVTRGPARPSRIDQRTVGAIAYLCVPAAIAAGGNPPGGVLLLVALVAIGAVAGYVIADVWAPALALSWLVVGVLVRDSETGIISGLILALAPTLLEAAALGLGALVARRIRRWRVRGA